MSDTTNAETVAIAHVDADEVAALVPEMARLYAAVYQEPPYHEGPDDVAAFMEGMPRRAVQRAFRLVTAAVGGELVGFAFGHQLTADTRLFAD